MSKPKLILIGAGVVVGYIFAQKLTGLNIPGGFNPFAYVGQKSLEIGS